MEPLTIDDIAEFTWDFGQNFLLETNRGLFVWSDPDYSGDNTIRRINHIEEIFPGGTFGRSKGTHFIGEYCGSEVKIIN